MKDESILSEVNLPDTLVPLRLVVQGKREEAVTLINSYKEKGTPPQDYYYVLEAELYGQLAANKPDQYLNLVQLIIQYNPDSFFANYGLYSYYFEIKEWTKALIALKRAVSIAPGAAPYTQKLISTVVALDILTKNPYEARYYMTFLEKGMTRFFAQLGICTISSTTKILVTSIIFYLLSLFYPYILYFFLPGAVFSLIIYLWGNRRSSSLVMLVSRYYET